MLAHERMVIYVTLTQWMSNKVLKKIISMMKTCLWHNQQRLSKFYLQEKVNPISIYKKHKLIMSQIFTSYK